MRVALATLLLVGGWLALPAVSLAHEIRPALITITFADEAHYNIELSVNLEALLAGVSPAHKDTNESPNAQRYNDLRALPPEKLQELFQALPLEQRLAGLSAEQIRQYLEQLTAGGSTEKRKPRRKK